MRKQKMWHGLCVALAVAMVMIVGGCGASAGKTATDTSAGQTVQDTEDLSSASQETSDTSALSSKDEYILEASVLSSEGQSDSASSESLSAGQMARNDLAENETESVMEQAQISVTAEENASEIAILETEENQLTLPENMPSEFYFSSGAGGWSTQLWIRPDGNFSGAYLDSDLGTSDNDYPNGTVYYCYFYGNLEVVGKLDDYSYALKLANLVKEKGGEYIDDGIRYVPSEPYGMEKGKSYILYLPETPLEGLSEEFLMWWPGRYDMQEQKRTILGYYGLYNKDMEYGFFGEVE